MPMTPIHSHTSSCPLTLTSLSSYSDPLVIAPPYALIPRLPLPLPLTLSHVPGSHLSPYPFLPRSILYFYPFPLRPSLPLPLDLP